jgi:hypothetical protein
VPPVISAHRQGQIFIARILPSRLGQRAGPGEEAVESS